MASAILHICNNCEYAIEAWSDGNPYYIDDAGKKKYAYHPDHENLARCIGNDDPHICLSCGHGFMVDSRAPVSECPTCRDADIVSTYQLGGRRCPNCKTGSLPDNPGISAIS